MIILLVGDLINLFVGDLLIICLDFEFFLEVCIRLDFVLFWFKIIVIMMLKNIL